MTAAGMKSKLRGFTLVELMIVVAVIGILVAVAFPFYQQYVRKGNRQAAKATLMTLAQLQERYYTTNSIYIGTIGTLVGLPGATTVYAGDDPADNRAKFAVTQVAGSGGAGCTTLSCGFLLTATANGTYLDPECGSLTLSSTGVRGKVGGTATLRECW